MSRRRAREFALQALYGLDQARDAPAARMLTALWEFQVDERGFDTRPADSGEQEYAGKLVSGVKLRQSEIDGLIEAASTNWRLVRMPVVDRNLLRMATYELLVCHDVPASVAINEAVELAKRYGEKESRAFVNGILDRIASELGRGGRRHRDRR
ncbi:MAG TPA: transcription antitermination factor NusB [Deltaproteobacteria bacterium]|mgnify:CR=1 FL=1|nr:transcription antitermination factor NusB [Deltaproteobacteria bacterium]